jgi:hypothetical protein
MFDNEKMMFLRNSKCGTVFTLHIRVSLLIHEIFVYRVACVVYFNTPNYIHDKFIE